MMKSLKSLAILFALCLPAHAQQRNGPQDYIANSITFTLQNPPQTVDTGQVSIQLLDNPGPATYCYWIVSNFTIGNSFPAGPVCVSNGPNALVSGIKVAWSSVAGANTYDVLRTSSPATSPSGACGCAIATAVSGLSAIDTGLSAYTVNTFVPSTFNMVMDNEPATTGQSQFALRVNGSSSPLFTVNSSLGFGLTTLNLQQETLVAQGTATSSQNFASGNLFLDSSFWNGSAPVTLPVEMEYSPSAGTTPNTFLSINFPNNIPQSSFIELQNTKQATSSANVNSPILQIVGESWTGTASQTDLWEQQDVMGSGANPSNTLTFTHTGGSGAASITDNGSFTSTGTINAVSGYQVNGTALAASNLSNGTTGSGTVVLGTTIGSGSVVLGTTLPEFLAGTPNVSAFTANANTTSFQLLQNGCASAPCFSSGVLNTVGKTIRLTAAGSVVPVNTTETILYGVDLGGGVQQISGFIPVSTGQATWYATVICTVTTTGTSGVLNCGGAVSVDDSTGFNATNVFTVSANLANAITPQFAVSFSTASASNLATSNISMSESLN